MWQDKINKINQQDCLELMKEMPDGCVDLCVTDPPYGVNYEGGAVNEFKREKLVNDDSASIYEKIIPEIYRVMAKDSAAYIFYATSCEHDVFPMIKKVFGKYQQLIWFKTNTGFGAPAAHYHFDYEPFIFVRKGSPVWNGGGTKRSIWPMKKNPINELHPTQKPLWLIQEMIQNSSDKGMLIFDPFMGSWTTARACMEMERNFIGAELSADYCEIGKQRLRQQVLL